MPIYQDLINTDQALLKCSKAHPIVMAAWTDNGKITVLIRNGTNEFNQTIISECDIQNIYMYLAKYCNN